MAHAPENGLNQGRSASRGPEIVPVSTSPRVARAHDVYREAAREVRAAQAAFQAAQARWKQALDEFTEATLAED